MAALSAFVGHSFDEEDHPVNTTFLQFFDSLEASMGLTYEHAERAEGIGISDKVRKKMENKEIFIGIFTRKQLTISPDKLREQGFLKKKKVAHQEDCTWSASEWVIQESGYALGRGMRLLFLVEDVVKMAAALQGDMEWIPFKRENPTECFTRLTETLGSIKRQIEGSPVSETGTASPPEIGVEQKSSQVAEESKSDGDWLLEHRRKYRTLRELTVNKGDLDAASKELEQIVKSIKVTDFFQEPYWRSMFLKFKIQAGHEDGFIELKQLAEKSPVDSGVRKTLAGTYKDYKMYSEAANQYLQAASQTKEKIEKLELIAMAIDCYLEDKSNDKPAELLLKEFEDSSLSDSDKHRLFKELGKVSKRLGNIEEFIAFSEKALEYLPSDHGLRFDLSYQASEANRDTLAFHHYRILCGEYPSGAILNNIALLYDQFKMPGRSVLSLVQAINNHQETLASANLANKYIKEGFLDDALKLLEKAKEIPDYHKNVDGSLQKISNKKDEEQVEESKIVESAQPERKFLIKYAGAYAFLHKIDLNGDWTTKHGNIKLSTSGNQITGVGEVKSTVYPLNALAMVYAGTTNPASPTIEKKTIKLSGTLSNRALRYSIEITIGETLLGSQTSSFEGLMVVSDSGNSMEAFERETKEAKAVFYTVERVANLGKLS